MFWYFLFENILPRKILLEMVDPDPVLDMKGMSMEDITLLLKFIYTGEVVIEKGNVEHFLEAANELKIAGLTNMSICN